MHAQVITVTPELASEWLKKNDKNRKLNLLHVNKLADQMRQGKWSLNGQSISFDENGRLLDGQHRLNAIVASNIPVRTMVVTGVTDPEAFKTYDGISLKRGAAQVAGMMGLKDANNAIATARIVHMYETSESSEDFGFRLPKHPERSPADMAEIAINMSEELDYIIKLVPSILKRKSGCPAIVNGIALIFNRVDPVATEQFFTKIKSGVFSGEFDPCLMLRDRMMSGPSGISKADWKRTVGAIMIKSFNAFRKGNEIKNLRIRLKGENRENFPKIDGAEK